MFFIGIFGIEQKEKELREFENIVCPDCGRLSRAVLILQYTFFHVFFIPTFRWNRRYFIRVRGCGAVYEADCDDGRQLQSAGDIDFSRLKKVSSGFGAYKDYYTTCASCGSAFDSDFAYCPHCGARR